MENACRRQQKTSLTTIHVVTTIISLALAVCVCPVHFQVFFGLYWIFLHTVAAVRAALELKRGSL